MKKLRQIIKELSEARNKLEVAIKKELPIGTIVFYDHGKYERSGCVVDHGTDQVKIITSNDKKLWLYVYRIKEINIDEIHDPCPK
jgi:hypothetical protein